MAPSVATTWKPTRSVGCDLAVSRHLQRSVIAFISGTRIALTSTIFLPKAPRFQTAYPLPNQRLYDFGSRAVRKAAGQVLSRVSGLCRRIELGEQQVWE